jgi:gentisate 1,2-dioxygenase
VLWVDVLDLPLVEALGATSFEFDYREAAGARSNSDETIRRETQTIRLPAGHSTNVYGVGGVRPTFVSNQRGLSRGTPMFVYRWKDTERALNRLRDYEGSPFDGIMVEYTNPVNGEPVTTTMSFAVQLLRGGEHTHRHRHTSSTAYCCLYGNGKTIVGDKVLEWSRNDMFVVPSWAWHEHVNLDGKEEAVLYSVSDAPTLHRLGLYREEAA